MLWITLLDTYRLYNLETKRVVLSRDVRWAEWNKIQPSDGVSIFDEQPELLKQVSCIKKSEEYETVDLDEEDGNMEDSKPVTAAVKQPGILRQTSMETRAMKDAKIKDDNFCRTFDDKQR